MRKYLVIEGIHGSGKSTIAQAVANELQKLGYPAVYYHFPDEADDLGQVIRKVIADPNLVHQREITGLLYASFANIFHEQTKNDDKIYILDRHSVTTGLIFQQEMSRSTRLEIYRPGIEALRTQGSIIYLQIDKNIAKQRAEERNKKLSVNANDDVWKYKANDQFIESRFDELTEKYEKNLLPQAKKLGLDIHVISNSGKSDTTTKNIIKIIDL